MARRNHRGESYQLSLSSGVPEDLISRSAGKSKLRLGPLSRAKCTGVPPGYGYCSINLSVRHALLTSMQLPKRRKLT